MAKKQKKYNVLGSSQYFDLAYTVRSKSSAEAKKKALRKEGFYVRIQKIKAQGSNKKHYRVWVYSPSFRFHPSSYSKSKK